MSEAGEERDAGLVQVRRALLSVSDKRGVVEFATALANEFGIELLSTGGTARHLRDAGLAVRDVAEVTGFPEMMDGRVKTLHPRVHGGLLALRDDAGHVASMEAHGIPPIDLLCVNLYPFAATVARGAEFAEVVENIDIGGPAMIRSSAKNHRWVTVVTDADAYAGVLADLREHAGRTCGRERLRLAQRAFEHTAGYDAAIADYLAGSVGLPPRLRVTLTQVQPLRYGENPHQKAELYVEDGARPGVSVTRARQLHGKELSYINLLDADAALAAVMELAGPGAVIVKHATPCGFATADDLPTAFANAYAGDPVAAFGGIVAVNRVIDAAAAGAITAIDKLLEVIVAPGFSPEALELLRARWKNCRLLDVGPLSPPDPTERTMHKIAGGWLVQDRDLTGVDRAAWKIVSKRPPTATELADLELAWLACKHVKSNAIVLARGRMMVGNGAGQQDRVGAARIAIAKAGANARGAVAASDAFFPFPDGPQLLLDAGVTAIIHPGGSLRDAETTAAVDNAGAALLLTGQRHFRH